MKSARASLKMFCNCKVLKMCKKKADFDITTISKHLILRLYNHNRSSRRKNSTQQKKNNNSAYILEKHIYSTNKGEKA